MKIKIRRAIGGDEHGIAHVHVVSWRATYAGLIAQEVLDSLSEESRAKQWMGALADASKPVFVAEQNGQVIGFVAGGPEREQGCRFDSELYAIYVLPELQAQGVGRSLQQSLMQELKARGFKRMRLWVLKDNPASGFYAREGGKLLSETKDEVIGGKAYPHRAYGWEF